MVDILTEMVLYGFYLFIAMIIANGHRDSNAFYLTKHIESLLWTDSDDSVSFYDLI